MIRVYFYLERLFWLIRIFTFRAPLHAAFIKAGNVAALIKSTPVASCPQWDSLSVSVLQFTRTKPSLSECHSTKGLICTYMLEIGWERWMGRAAVLCLMHIIVQMFDNEVLHLKNVTCRLYLPVRGNWSQALNIMDSETCWTIFSFNLVLF